MAIWDSTSHNCIILGLPFKGIGRRYVCSWFPQTIQISLEVALIHYGLALIMMKRVDFMGKKDN